MSIRKHACRQNEATPGESPRRDRPQWGVKQVKVNMQIDFRKIETLVPYARNPRRNDHAVQQMVASIREFGFKIPILIRSDGEVVDGHLRVKAARAMDLEQVPVILCDEWTEAQVKAFRLLVNRSASWADWD